MTGDARVRVTLRTGARAEVGLGTTGRWLVHPRSGGLLSLDPGDVEAVEVPCDCLFVEVDYGGGPVRVAPLVEGPEELVGDQHLGPDPYECPHNGSDCNGWRRF